jgi:hypothetical protein
LLGLILVIAFIVFAVKHTSEIKPQKKQIIESGVNEDVFDIYLIGLWFYLIPPLLGGFLPLQFYTILILAAFYLPSIITGSKIYKKLSRGYDYTRRIGNKINLAVWIGYGAITLWVGKWLIDYLIDLLAYK